MRGKVWGIVRRGGGRKCFCCLLGVYIVYVIMYHMLGRVGKVINVRIVVGSCLLRLWGMLEE
jgi:hypothetical protein